jgi:hypothetical protein
MRAGRERTDGGRSVVDVEERGHRLPLGESLLELKHLILERADLLADMHKLGIAGPSFSNVTVAFEEGDILLEDILLQIG